QAVIAAPLRPASVRALLGEATMRAQSWLLLGLGLLASCGDAAPPPPVSPSLEERIEAAVQRISADTCFAKDDTTECDWGDYEVGPAYFDMEVSTGEAILIVDSLGEGLFPQFVRYRNRILGVYRVNGDNVEADQTLAHLPRQLGEALVSLAGPEFIPASSL